MTDRPIVLLGPSLSAVSGVSTHLAQLLTSRLAPTKVLLHFQVGSEGRSESPLARLGRLLVSPLMLAYFLLRSRAHIVHINTSMDRKAFWRDTVYLFVARALRRRVVYQIHGGELPQQFSRGRALRTHLLRGILSLPQAIVVLGERELDAYRRFVPAQRLLVIANAVEVGSGPPLIRAEVRDRPLRLAFMGRLVRPKGIYELLDAVATLRRSGVAVELALAGAGSEQVGLERRVLELGLGGVVSFKGALYGSAKDDLWRWADVFVCPSYSEGLPYALLESMAAGLVPVVTGVGAIPDVITEGVHGLLVPPRDEVAIAAAVMRLDRDRLGLGRMSAACQRRIRESYTTARMSDDFLLLYNSL